MTVWGDLLFLINFSMDFLCFYLSCLLLRERMHTLRACIASAVGGVYSVAALFITARGAISFLLDMAVLALMCCTVYCKRGVSGVMLLKRMGLYFLVSSLLGGFMSAAFALLNRLDLFGADATAKEGLDVWVFALLALISAALTLKGGAVFRSNEKEKRAAIRIEEGGKAVVLSALIDSGNRAREPISGRSVVFANIDACREVLGEDEYSLLKSGCDITELPFSLARRVRPIFSASIGGRSVLPSLRFERAYLVCGKRKKELDIYVALLDCELAGEYDAIMSNELIT